MSPQVAVVLTLKAIQPTRTLSRTSIKVFFRLRKIYKKVFFWLRKIYIEVFFKKNKCFQGSALYFFGLFTLYRIKGLTFAVCSSYWKNIENISDKRGKQSSVDEIAKKYQRKRGESQSSADIIAKSNLESLLAI